MDNQALTEESQGRTIGRIEVAPEVIVTIAYHAALNVPGVAKTIDPHAGLFRRATARRDGVILTYEENRLHFDIYVCLRGDVNMVKTSRAVQEAIFEAMDNMVGVPVDAVNIHVENIIPSSTTSETK